MHIGLDLDNTLIDYEAAFAAAARALPADPLAHVRGKTAIRDRLRALPEGEAQWMALQAHVYGPGIGAARLYPGVEAFIHAAAAAGVRLSIVSHKSEFAAAAPQGPNLRACARTFLAERGIELPVWFESTRAEKCARLTALQVTHAVDDLVEVFRDPAFPRGVERWLFAPHGAPADAPAERRFASWDELREALP